MNCSKFVRSKSRSFRRAREAQTAGEREPCAREVRAAVAGG